MGRLKEIKRKLLTLEDFDKYPVWGWDDEMENLHPISDEKPSLQEYIYLFVRSKFISNNGLFDGYLMFLSGNGIYGFCLIVDNREYIFNVSSKSHNQEKLVRLTNHLNISSFNLFPIQYESDVVLQEYGKISGALDFRF